MRREPRLARCGVSRISPEMRDVLACPRCQGALHDVESDGRLIGLRCDRCSVVYPVERDIPVLLADAGMPDERVPAED